MIVQFELWQLISLAMTLLGAAFGGAKLLGRQVESRVTEKFAGQDKKLDTLQDEFCKVDRRINQITQKVDTMNEELARTQERVGGLPSYAALNHALNKVYESLNAQAQTLHQMVGENREQGRVLTQIFQHLVEHAKQ